MSAIICYTIRCDRCGFDYETGWQKAAQARRDAAAEGWTRPVHRPEKSRMRIDACSDCATAVTR